MRTVYAYAKLGLVGRLGNQLWQVAATLNHAAASRDARAAIPADWEYRPYVSLPDAIYQAPQPGEQAFEVSELWGGPYFQYLDAISLVAPLLRDLYAPSSLAEARLKELHDGRLGGPHKTAIHVRRTDYLENPERFPQMTPRYWHEATEAVLAEHPDTTFFVFSDDIGWCRAHSDELNVTGRAEYVEGHVRPIPPRQRRGEPADIYDLWLMADCDAHIIANSSYSWWGAFLSDQKQVFYPDRWFGESAQHSERMWEAFPSSWRQIRC